MNTTITLDFADLLKPISEEQPAGIDLRSNYSKKSLYYQLRELRSNARSIERQQAQQTLINDAKPNWTEIIKLASVCLAQYSKDLEITTWLIEGLLREQGFGGLRDRFKLLSDLLAQYWDDLYPQEDEDGLITKINALVGLNGSESEGTLIVPIAMTPLIESQSFGTFSLWQYQQALELSQISNPDKKNQRIARGAVTLERIQMALHEIPPIVLKRVQQQVNECIQNFSHMDSFLREKCGADAPPTSRINRQLISCRDCLNSISTGEADNPFLEDEIAQSNQPVSLGTTELLVTERPLKAFTSRDQALGQLLRIADFFRRSEPHSPLSYILERAVRWGRLPLPELLQELVHDNKALESLCNLTGIGNKLSS